MGPEETVRKAYSAMSEQYIGLFDDGWEDRTHPEDMAIIRDHLTGLSGPVLDLGCGPGHWTGHLHSSGVDVTGIDLVPRFIEHARQTHPGPDFQLGSLTDVDLPAGSVAGVLSWYSTIHMAPVELDRALAEFRRLLQVSGVLVVGFFDSAGEVATFGHKVTTAYHWPVAVFAEHLAQAGFVELQRVQYALPERPDRRFAAIAAAAR
ncbi:class I SAM-dependent DNA methyltransferase [Actinomycetospora soli]|uniref:class I SAM-dependent DNA methyltransferase n=1 Tax=Actinomycetospora soli TaxID=2893887 RepID=UPI001E568EEA|nr:class I SAM-dependent methyltransferase [Actinomycetospora soli]MCD2191010.1 class I SAM-dependent methyltransferase [Actinomycetospora soli]